MSYMCNISKSYKIEIRQMDDGQWWFYADNGYAADAIAELITQMKGNVNV
jgi:hypothetical protein